MKILNKTDSIDLIRSVNAKYDANDFRTFGEEGDTFIQLKTPKADSLNYLAYQLAFSTRFDLWNIAILTDYQIFPNFENTFLYYQLRKSSGDFGHIADGPGHLFLQHENYELFSLIEIAILNSWDLAVFSQMNYTRYKTSHDGFVDIYSNDDELIKTMQKFKLDQNV